MNSANSEWQMANSIIANSFESNMHEWENGEMRKQLFKVVKLFNE